MPDLVILSLLAEPSGRSSLPFQNGSPVNANIVLARFAVMPFDDFVSLGNSTARVTSR
jgi:hypothetical protein